MSELFDSLRTAGARKPSSPRPATRAHRGDAVLASLGYKPVRRTNPMAVGAVAVVALLAAGYYAWNVWYSPVSGLRATTVAAGRTVPPPRREPAPVVTAAPTKAAPLPSEEIPVATTDRTRLEPRPTAVVPASAPEATVETRARPVSKSASAPRPPSTASEAEAFNLAVYHQRAGDFESALLAYRSVLETNELNAQARNNLGLLYLDKGLHEDAVRELKRALIIDPRYARARNNLGVALMRLKKPTEAAAEFQSVLAHDPRNVDALVNLALVEKADGTVERAKELLIRAVGISPRSAWAHYNLAVVFDHSGEVTRAVEHYRAFLDNAGPDVSARAPDVRARLDALTRR